VPSPRQDPREVKPDTPVNALKVGQPWDAPVPHTMNPELDDMDAPPRAANPAVKRGDSALCNCLRLV
jgi:hypothetical protein